MGMKGRGQGTFEHLSKEKKYWGLVELEKEKKVSLYQADSLLGLSGSGEQVSLDRIKTTVYPSRDGYDLSLLHSGIILNVYDNEISLIVIVFL